MKHIVILSDETVAAIPEGKLNAPDVLFPGNLVRRQHKKEYGKGKLIVVGVVFVIF